MFIPRLLKVFLDEFLVSPKSLLFWGPRQTGKTTLMNNWLPSVSVRDWEIHQYNLHEPATRLKLETDQSILKKELTVKRGTKKLVYIDEVQKVPALMDVIQLLIDEHKAEMKFILTGSSARKLRRAGANLLPGRVVQRRMDALTCVEMGWHKEDDLSVFHKIGGSVPKINYAFEDALVWGMLPEITLLEAKDRNETLRSYVELYLEQEIRAEALVRNVGAFNRFLELAALESGTSPNLTNLSNASGLAVSTIKEYYAILEDTFVAERIEPFISRSRKRLLLTPRYYFFDTGIRNACGRIPLEHNLLRVEGGRLFEHFVILEVAKRIRVFNLPWRMYFWRTSAGAEVDLVIDTREKIIPVEIKFQKNVSLGNLKGLSNFIADHASRIDQAYVVASVDAPQRLSEKIIVIPWQML